MSTSVFAGFDLEAKLKKILPDAEIEKLENSDHFISEYSILINQPLDHNDPSAGSFKQRIFLSHYNHKAPVLMVTEGYSARQRTYELSKILMSNQITVEYRFFGKSIPDEMDWKYLTNDQAMEDLHRIKKLFCKVYRTKKWVSTGISKGGTTCLIYRAKYPKDVKVAIPYVAPLAEAREDKRCDDHILSIGTEECRDKLAAFQHAALDHRDSMLILLDTLAERQGLTFAIGKEKAFEFCVLEYTFSFWQWGHDCARVPENPNAQETFDHLVEIVGFDFYSDAVVDYFRPAFYQFMKENGYYGFIHEHVQDKLQALESFDNSIFGPAGVDLSFDKSYLDEVREKLTKKGDKIIHIQGELDPWGACGFIPPDDQDALYMKKKGGSHFTRISSFSKQDQAIIYMKLEEWLGIGVEALE
jgi:hypothetical protein